MSWIKRSVSYKGLDCLKDVDSPLYEMASNHLQMEVPWVDQPKYAKYTVYFGVVVIFLATMKNIWYRYVDYSFQKKLKGGNSFVNVFVSYFRYIGYKQIPRKVCYFTSLPPSVGSALFLLASTIYLFCYCMAPHFWYRSCRGFGSPPLAVRAGIMATALTPFVYVLSGKSNMISLLTGISYEKLNVFHKYVGVATFVLSVIHTIPFIYQDLQEGGASHLHTLFVTDFAYYSGLPPLILLGILCMLSKAWFRNLFYEGFIHIHWICGIAYFGTLWWHINNTLGMQDYMYGALAFWATQLIYRILIKTTFRPNRLFMRPRKAELVKLGYNVYQASISSESLSWKPGQHCFLRFVGTRIFDNHPFSISSVDDGIDGNDMKFIILPKGGLTKELYEELDDFTVKNKKVYLDGPYGGTERDHTTFNNVLLIATGSGITATLPFLSTIVNDTHQKKQKGMPVICERVNFIWIIRHTDDLKWTEPELNRCIDMAGNLINVDIYVCHDDPRDKGSETRSFKDGSDIEKTILRTSTPNPAINIHHFRPFVPQIVNNLAPSFSKRNMVVCSGSDSTKVEASQTVASLQSLVFNNDLNNLGIEEIYLHTESFGW